jgi:quinoprotein glucose dehydrogenase
MELIEPDNPPAIPSLVSIEIHLESGQIASTVKQDKGPMPGFPKLPEKDVNDLISYLSNPLLSPELPVEAPSANASAGPVRYESGFGYMKTSCLSPITPSWTSLTAYDLSEGTIKWKIPLGEVPDLAAKDFKDTGSYFPRTGPVVTGGG